MNTLRELHDRLGAMIDQLGHPDYSLREMVTGLRQVRDDLFALSQSAPTNTADRELLAELRDYFERLKHRADVRGGPDTSAMCIADEAIEKIIAALRTRSSTQESYSAALTAKAGEDFETWWKRYRTNVVRRTEREIARDAWLAFAASAIEEKK